MTIRNIQIFLTVCREGCSITDAAKKLYISQPSVSAAIRTLENELGTPLFERLSKRLYLTESGKTFLTYAQRILLLYDELNSSFAEGNENEPLRIGASITIGSTILPDLAKRFSKAYPDSRLKVQIRRSRVLQEMIKANELDMALVETPIEDPLLPVEKFFESSLEVIAPADYPEASLSLEKLTSLPLILREKGSGTRDLFDRVLASRSVAAEPVWETESPEAVLEAASCGIGLGVLPRERITEAVQKNRVRIVPVEGLSFPLSFYLVIHRDKILTERMWAFRKLVLRYRTGDGGEESRKVSGASQPGTAH